MPTGIALTVHPLLDVLPGVADPLSDIRDADEFGIQLRRVGSGSRMTFGAGEQALSAWMAENALSAGWSAGPGGEPNG